MSNIGGSCAQRAATTTIDYTFLWSNSSTETQGHTNETSVTISSRRSYIGMEDIIIIINRHMNIPFPYDILSNMAPISSGLYTSTEIWCEEVSASSLNTLCTSFSTNTSINFHDFSTWSRQIGKKWCKTKQLWEICMVGEGVCYD